MVLASTVTRHRIHEIENLKTLLQQQAKRTAAIRQHLLPNKSSKET